MQFSFEDYRLYREGNQIEAKSALHGLPSSIWETYSAFANTYGGVILLGVEEEKDGSFVTSGLRNSDKLIKDEWLIVEGTIGLEFDESLGNNIPILHVDRLEGTTPLKNEYVTFD